jgi:hypothetical protein
MTAPRLSTRIREAALAPDVARTFANGLRQVMGQDTADGTTKSALMGRLLGALKEGPEPAPFDALWPHRELFLTGCITMAVADGEYRVEEARLISHFAHRLGLSARQLADLEARVFGQLAARGADVRRRQADAGLSDSGSGHTGTGQTGPGAGPGENKRTLGGGQLGGAPQSAGGAGGFDAPDPGALKTEEAELTEPTVAGTPRTTR